MSKCEKRCEDCVHYECCCDWVSSEDLKALSTSENCATYKDKSLFFELPCEDRKPPTNFDKITENEGTLAKFIIDTVTQCQFNNCEDCPLYEVDGCSRQEKVKEWLQQEIDDEDIKEK